MNTCASDEASRADAQLNDVYRTLLQKITDQTAATKIKLAERAWIAYRDAYIEAMYPAEDKQAGYGSVYPMEIALLRAKLTRAQIAALQDLSQQNAGAPPSLPEGFASSVREVKAKTRVPILLPSSLPDSIAKAKHVVQDAAEDSYDISLYYELEVGDSGFAAEFAGNAKPGSTPEGLPTVERVPLAQGLIGFFIPLGCGVSCSPPALSWQQNGVQYQISLNLPYNLNDRGRQKAALIAAVNSAITAGPR